MDTTYGGDQTAMITAAANATVWLSWVVNLLVAEWWLQRGRATRVRARLSAPTVAPDLTRLGCQRAHRARRRL